MHHTKINKLTAIAMLSAIIILLQFLSNYISIAGVSITLSLIPIVVGACIYGPSVGAILGFIMGCITLVAPSTLSFFFPYSPFGTIITCLAKSTLAGLFSGLVFNIFKGKSPHLGSIISSIIVPIINTGLFVLFVLLFFIPLIQELVPQGKSFYEFFFLTFIGINFLIEFVTNAILSIVVYQVYLYANRRKLKKVK